MALRGRIKRQVKKHLQEEESERMHFYPPNSLALLYRSATLQRVGDKERNGWLVLPGAGKTGKSMLGPNHLSLQVGIDFSPIQNTSRPIEQPRHLSLIQDVDNLHRDRNTETEGHRIASASFSR